MRYDTCRCDECKKSFSMEVRRFNPASPGWRDVCWSLTDHDKSWDFCSAACLAAAVGKIAVPRETLNPHPGISQRMAERRAAMVEVDE